MNSDVVPESGSSRSYTQYVIKVEVKQLDRSWTVQRRFSDFFDMRLCLKEDYGVVEARLPPRRLLPLSNKVTSERLLELQDFLNLVCTDEQMCLNDAFKEVAFV